MQFMRRLQKDVVRGQIPLLLPPPQPKPTPHSHLPHLIVFYPAAKLMSPEHYYNRFKQEKSRKKSHLLKPASAAPSAVVNTAQRSWWQRCLGNGWSEKRSWSSQASATPSKTWTVNHGVYTELSTHAWTLEWVHISKRTQAVTWSEPVAALDLHGSHSCRREMEHAKIQQTSLSLSPPLWIII